MISIDQLEVLLRTAPQYLLFGGVSLYIFAWVNKNIKMALWADAIMVLTGLLAIAVIISGVIPSPDAPGMVEAHIKAIIRILTLLCIIGVLGIGNLLVKLIWKKKTQILSAVIFGLALIVFFQSTRISRIKFELNPPPTEAVSE
ncbi:MAG: hypothetical protein JW842_04175 [Prolixibacteraceae bacterium]|nr:hypothetical protein [Prolixibacteraceae bacterium]